MTQTIGTGWLIPPKRDPNEDAAFKQLISRMTTMDEVRPFMCPKSNGNPKKCEKCDGFRTCTAGQMAIRISTEETKPVYERKWTDEPKSLPNPASQAQKLNEEREEFIRACESGNAWNYLMETRHLTKNAAGEVLSRMVRQFPGLAADYGGSRRIMQRPKVVKITEIAPEKPRVDEKPASVPQDGQTEDRKADEPEQPKNGEKPEAAIQARVNSIGAFARKRCEEAVASGDPRQFLLDQGRTAHNVDNTISRWRKQYPELMASIPSAPKGPKKGTKPVKAQLREGFYEECMAQEDPIGYYAEQRNVSRHSAAANLGVLRRKNERQKKAEKPPEPTEAEPEPPEFDILPPEHDVNTGEAARDDDEISLADFLSEFDHGGAEQAQTEAPRAAQEAAVKADPMIRTMNDRLEELRAEKERLRAEIEKAEERIKCIEEQQDALAACLSAFRRASTGTGRS